MGPVLKDLPREILFQVLLHLPDVTVLKFEQVCHSFNDLCGPVIWRHLCKQHFTYWDHSHDFVAKLSRPVEEIDWKWLYAERFRTNKLVNREIDSILASQDSRTLKQKKILDVGYDAKDALLHNLNVGDEASDVLARRWYSEHTLSCLNRSIAIEQWVKLREQPRSEVPLEAALAAFDMFVVQNGSADIEDVSQELNQIADQFRRYNSDYTELSIQEQALEISKFLRDRNLVGIDENVDMHYHDLRNNFIRSALRDERHPSLPLISAAIYCSVAQRLGLDARPCGFPFHVLAVIQLDDYTSPASEDQAKPASRSSIYLDPFRSEDVVPVKSLNAQLGSMGAPLGDYERLLGPAPIAEIVSRCARNIITSVQTLPRNSVAVANVPNVESSFYAALWALLLLPSGHEDEVSMMQQAWYLPRALRLIAGQYPTDTWLVQKHLISKIESIGNDTAQTLKSIRADADAPKPIKKRDTKASMTVRYKIGQVLYHKRYHYYAIIYGWDVHCSADEGWMMQMRVDDLPRGREQSFYHVLASDKSTRYVAEENIQIVKEEPKPSLVAIAGQYFKRWDHETKSFVSNVRDEYPND